MAETDETMRSGTFRFATAEDMFAELDKPQCRGTAPSPGPPLQQRPAAEDRLGRRTDHLVDEVGVGEELVDVGGQTSGLGAQGATVFWTVALP